MVWGGRGRIGLWMGSDEDGNVIQLGLGIELRVQANDLCVVYDLRQPVERELDGWE